MQRIFACLFHLILIAAMLVPAYGINLLDDRNITITSAADVGARRQALINFIWGSAGFPADKMPQVLVRGDLSPVGPIPNLERVDTLTYEMEHGIRSYAHHFVPLFKNNPL